MLFFIFIEEKIALFGLIPGIAEDDSKGFISRHPQAKCTGISRNNTFEPP
jgi:hypothetical protein